MFTCCTLAAASRGSSAGTWVSAGRSATPCKEPSACTPRWSNPLCRLLRLQRQPPQVLPWLQQYLCPESLGTCWGSYSLGRTLAPPVTQKPSAWLGFKIKTDPHGSASASCEDAAWGRKTETKNPAQWPGSDF